MLWLELNFYIETDVSGWRKHEVVHALIVVAAGRSRQLGVERSLAVDHPKIACQ